MTGAESLFIYGATGFVVSFVVLTLILRVWRRKLTRRVAEFHHAQNASQAPVPRYGGLGLAAAFVALVGLRRFFNHGFQTDASAWVIVGTALAMFGLGFWDDVRPLGAKRKMLGQVVVSSAAYFLGVGIHVFKIPFLEHMIDLGFYSWFVTVFWLVAMTNLVNLIDGVDGLAGGIALMVMVLLGVVGDAAGFVAPVAVGMVGALVAFLRFNFPPAKIYLGDGGAYFLGFLIGCLAISNSHKGTVVAALIAPLFVMALPILDTSLSLMRRALNGLPLFRPDQGHLHHRLLQSGLSRQDVTLGAYAFTAYFLGLGLLAFWWRGQFLALTLGAGTMAVLLVACRFSFSRGWFNLGAVLSNAFCARAEINYALAHARWLAMEGLRGESIQAICEDTAMVARRLGFISMRIQCENGETVWKMTDCPNWEACARQTQAVLDGSWRRSTLANCGSHVFRHHLPGQRGCFIELQTPDLNRGGVSPCRDLQWVKAQPISPSKFRIVSEVLAEGWAKAVMDWHQRHQQPIHLLSRQTDASRFGFRSATSAADAL